MGILWMQNRNPSYCLQKRENNVIIFNYYKIGSVEFQYVTKYVDDNNNVIYSSGNLTTKDNILTVAADAKKAPGYIITPTRITKNMTVGEVTEFVFNCTAKSYNITYVNVEGTTWNGAGTNPNPSTYKTTDADITLVIQASLILSLPDGPAALKILTESRMIRCILLYPQVPMEISYLRQPGKKYSLRKR